MSTDEPATITLRALVTARWVLIGIVVAIAGVDALANGRVAGLDFGSSPPLFALLILLAWVTQNVVVALLIGRGKASSTMAGAHLIVDATALTLLLASSGGVANPFTTLYLVPITLATQVSPRWTWTLAAYCVISFASLFALAPVPPADAHAHHHGSQFAGHLQGMWVAFGVSGLLITIFVHRIALSLARQQRELQNLRKQAEESRLLASLGTLAAGAAHELGTPLGTIALLSSELEHMVPGERDDAIIAIRRQVGRCKEIVRRMASPELRVEALTRGGREFRLTDLEPDLLEAAGEVPLELDVGSDVATCTQPKEAVGQILRELVSNAREACREKPDAATIRVRIRTSGESVLVEIEDDGGGMAAGTLARAFDPFFSTRTEGEGLGMGLFVARAHVRQLGGDLVLDSVEGRGTKATVRLPLRAS